MALVIKVNSLIQPVDKIWAKFIQESKDVQGAFLKLAVWQQTEEKIFYLTTRDLVFSHFRAGQHEKAALSQRNMESFNATSAGIAANAFATHQFCAR